MCVSWSVQSCQEGAELRAGVGPVEHFNCKLPTSLVLRLLKESSICIDLRSLLDQPPSTARQLHLLVGHPEKRGLRLCAGGTAPWLLPVLEEMGSREVNISDLLATREAVCGSILNIVRPDESCSPSGVICKETASGDSLFFLFGVWFLLDLFSCPCGCCREFRLLESPC